MVKNHSDSERGNPLLPHGLLFPISRKGSFIWPIPQTVIVIINTLNPKYINFQHTFKSTYIIQESYDDRKQEVFCVQPLHNRYRQDK